MATIPNCTRKAPRMNMFVMAAMSAGAYSGPIKIRNLSSTGALIEGSRLPPAGTKVTLRRGDSTATGEIVWCSGGKAGMHVEGHVEVADWMPGGHAHLNSVDCLVEQVKHEIAIGLNVPAPEKSCRVGAAELRALADAICLLADDLAGDEGTVARFALKLQTLDIAAQILRKLAAER